MLSRSSRRRSRPGRRGRVRARSAYIGISIALVAVLLSLPWLACVGGPPDEPDDICSIFREKRGWHQGAVRARERWGVPESVQLAIIHQESSFRATARPPRKSFLWVLPGRRVSSAYGYGQVVDETWDRYRRAEDRRRASRDDFGDVVDFIGWYADRIHRRTGVAKSNATELYAAYHEGPGGYLRGTHLSKGWLSRVAVRVGHRASRYQAQYETCRADLSRPRFLGLF